MIKIIKEENVNSGGNCMVEFMTVVGIGDTKTIGFSSDCFVGYNCTAEEILFDGTQELWVAHSNQQLRDLLGVVNSGVILQKHKLGGGY